MNDFTGGVWATRPVSEVPSITLAYWAVFELSDGDRHFAGCNITEGGTGRASSKIVTFDKETMRGVTASGRVYELRGEPGLEGDGSYVWSRWCAINRIEPGSYKDVSETL